MLDWDKAAADTAYRAKVEEAEERQRLILEQRAQEVRALNPSFAQEKHPPEALRLHRSIHAYDSNQYHHFCREALLVMPVQLNCHGGLQQNHCTRKSCQAHIRDGFGLASARAI